MKIHEKYITEAKKRNNEELKDIIGDEGLGYAIQFDISWKNIEDNEIAKLWKIASDAMDKIETKLGL